MSLSRVWLDEHVVAKRTARPRLTYALSHTHVWTSGITTSDMLAFSTAEANRTIGASLQPFQGLNLTVGTELTRSGGQARFLTSTASWQAFWSQDWEEFGGLHIGLSTTGGIGTQNPNYWQSVSGTLGVPLGQPIPTWQAELRFLPSASLDTSSGQFGSGLTSEIVSQRVLSAPTAELRSVLNLIVGYHLAPHARPVASARVEIRISPNL